MNRIFGTKKAPAPAPKGPSLSEASKHMDERASSINEKIRQCDEELLKYKAQMKTPSGAAAVKQRALTVLKRKKMYEQQRDQLLNQQFNVDQVAFPTESMQTTLQTVDAMKVANHSLKTQMKSMDIDEIERVHEDMADLMMDMEEINELTSRCYSVPDGFDETELDAEFAALEEEMMMEPAATANSAPAYLPTADPMAGVPAVPTADPVAQHSAPIGLGPEVPGFGTSYPTVTTPPA